MGYTFNILISLDQLANTLLAGQPDETLSSRAWRAERDGQRYWGWTRRAIDMLFFWQAAHCESAYYAEVQHLQEPEEFRRSSP